MSADEFRLADPKSTTPKPPPNSKNDQLDVYVLKSIYPDAASVFQAGPKPLEAIKGDCLVAVDTNALLLPYTTSVENLAEIKKTYARLVHEERFFVPAQVAREFAKNRADKIGDLYNALSQKQGTENQFTPAAYPLLNEFPDYQRVAEIAREIGEKRKEYQQALKAVVNHIKDWAWSDPVSAVYAQTFTDRNVVEAEISEENFEADCLRRQSLSIPPGFKDSSNGDLMIWHTILEIGAKYKKDLVFVSGDEKTDWRLRSNGRALYPRFELVEEYRRASEGGSFHIVRLSELLELFGAEQKAVKEVQIEEAKDAYGKARGQKTGIRTVQRGWEDFQGQKASEKLNASVHLANWLSSEYGPALIEYNTDSFPDLSILFPSNRMVGFEIRFMKEPLSSTAVSEVWSVFRQAERGRSRGEFSDFVICLICSTRLLAEQIIPILKEPLGFRDENNIVTASAFSESDTIWTGTINSEGGFSPVVVTDLADR